MSRKKPSLLDEADLHAGVPRTLQRYFGERHGNGIELDLDLYEDLGCSRAGANELLAWVAQEHRVPFTPHDRRRIRSGIDIVEHILNVASDDHYTTAETPEQ